VFQSQCSGGEQKFLHSPPSQTSQESSQTAPCPRAPSVGNFKAIVHANLIRSNPVAAEDIDILEKAFRPDIGSIKGKTARSKPGPVVKDCTEIPRELFTSHQNIILCVDGLKINSIPFLAAASHNILCRTCEFVSSQNCDVCRSAPHALCDATLLAGVDAPANSSQSCCNVLANGDDEQPGDEDDLDPECGEIELAELAADAPNEDTNAADDGADNEDATVNDGATNDADDANQQEAAEPGQPTLSG